MSYVEQVLTPGETITYRGHLSGFLWAGPVVWGLILVLATAGAGLLVAVPWWLVTWLRARGAEFAVTSERVILKDGVLQRHAAELLLNRIESANVDQGLLGRMGNYGTVTITGTGGTRERFGGIASPMQFAEQVRAAVIARQRTAPPP